MPHQGRGTPPMAEMTARPRLRRKSNATEGEVMRKALEIGGLVAAVVLIAFGIGAIVMGLNGRSTVNDSLKEEQIRGTQDMTPAAMQTEVGCASEATTRM